MLAAALALAMLPQLVAAREVQVMLSAKQASECGKFFTGQTWIPRAVLPTLGIPSKTCSKDCGSVAATGCTAIPASCHVRTRFLSRARALSPSP